MKNYSRVYASFVEVEQLPRLKRPRRRCQGLYTVGKTTLQFSYYSEHCHQDAKTPQYHSPQLTAKVKRSPLIYASASSYFWPASLATPFIP